MRIMISFMNYAETNYIQNLCYLSSGFGLIDEKMHHSHLETMSLFLLTTTKQKLNSN
jgi:hypothetical protein